MNRCKFLVYIFKEKSADEARRYPRLHPPLLFFLRGPHFLNFFFLHKPMWVEVMIQCLCFRIFTTQTHFHINLNLERLFSLMLNCILILEFKTFSETCRIFFPFMSYVENFLLMCMVIECCISICKIMHKYIWQHRR